MSGAGLSISSLKSGGHVFVHAVVHIVRTHVTCTFYSLYTLRSKHPIDYNYEYINLMKEILLKDWSDNKTLNPRTVLIITLVKSFHRGAGIVI